MFIGDPQEPLVERFHRQIFHGGEPLEGQCPSIRQTGEQNLLPQ